METCLGQYYDVYVPCRNPRLLCGIFQPHHCAVLLNFHWGWGSHLISLWTTYEPHPQQKFGNAVLQTWWRNQNMRWNTPLCKDCHMYICMFVCRYVLCSAQSEILCNLEIALCILRILRLRNTRVQSQDCACNAQSTNFQLCQYAWQWAIYCACVARRMKDSLDKASIGSLLRSGRVSNAVCW